MPNTKILSARSIKNALKDISLRCENSYCIRCPYKIFVTKDGEEQKGCIFNLPVSQWGWHTDNINTKEW